MATQESHSDIETLAAISAGDDVVIVQVLLRDGGSCDPLRVLRPGREWHCQFSGSINVLLINHAGQAVSVHRDTARFIQVRRGITR
jgi:hypothetical protein